jgi:hypothetical protein
VVIGDEPENTGRYAVTVTRLASSGGRPAGRWAFSKWPFFDRDLGLVLLEEDPVLIPTAWLDNEFPLAPSSRMTLRSSVLRMICGSRPLPLSPPRGCYRNTFADANRTRYPRSRLAASSRFAIIAWG